jgi:hypothetical protein
MTTKQKRLVTAVDCDDVLIATYQHILDDYNWGVTTRNEVIVEEINIYAAR